MNRVFKVIWNNVLQRKVVTSELGQSHRGGHTAVDLATAPALMGRPHRLWQALLLSGLLGVGAIATAQTEPAGCTISDTVMRCKEATVVLPKSNETENDSITSIIIESSKKNPIPSVTNQGIYNNATMKLNPSRAEEKNLF